MAYATRIAPAELPAQVPSIHPGQNLKKTRVYQPTTFAQNPHGQFRHRIIIGVDFGTTYSAIAWGSSSDPDSIEIINSWPTAGARVMDSCPTEISYHEGSTTEFNWGYDIPSTARRLAWFKLLLESDDPDIKRKVNIPDGLDVMDVCTDFLHALYIHTMETLYRKKGNHVMEITQVDFVLTVPAVWNDGAKQRTQKCAENAGFANGHRLTMISEPEAAAVFCIKNQDAHNIKASDRIVVCDAGGGTVDLITYNCLEISPRLRVRECAVGEGAFAGSSKIDRNFAEFFKSRMGSHFESLRLETQQKVIKNFEAIKCGFRDRPDQAVYTVTVPTINNLPEAGIENGEMLISREDMRSLFDPVITEVITLIYNQIKETSDNAGRVNTILLVGGFGESLYLYQRVVDWAGPYGINVIQPRSAATAIVKGAVIRGLEIHLDASNPGRTQVERLCRKNYGTVSSQLFIEGKHRAEDAWIDPQTGKKMARNQVSWFILKGQPLTDERRFSNHFHRNFKHITPFLDAMVASSSDNPPNRVEGDVHVVCRMTSDLSTVPKNLFDKKWKGLRSFYSARYRLDMTIESAEIKFELVYKDRSYGFAQCQFD
ncbi:hypothetical protein TWF788_007858 [Orbilia oligospora]|uniref:Actin-like ATPase domain-containing protein n=2 Tax=Orbilia oligospora TaxID=2813651 RepID=A0A7C8PRJ8_ORBOL|nr:hypothetical protein TWF788_007858 [Orbilia oligospora]KAF3230985.1 hypothetical protein TWF191_007716 [Orbilia oligospora]